MKSFVLINFLIYDVAMKIILARHGETTGDIEERYGGDYDDHLTTKGQSQSEELARQLGGKGVQTLFASPKIRAQETAGFVGDSLGLEVVTIDDFRERNSYGILTGMTKAEAKDKHPEQIEILKDVHAAAEGAEEYQPFQERITSALRNIADSNDSAVAVITHGGPTRLIFRDILKKGEIDVGDCAFFELEVIDGEFTLGGMNGITLR